MSELINISLEDKPDITHVQENFNTLNNDKLEVSNIVQGENISINVVDKIITISATGGGGTGIDGVSLQYNWDGTSLGIKREDEINYTYVNLKGQDGIIGSDGADGRNIEMRYDSTYLQYRLVGDMDWINLVQIETTGDLTALTGRVSTLETNQGDLTQVPTELQNKTIAEMITTNFTSGGNWKTTIANAITAKGVDTLATDTLPTFETNIGLISGGEESGGIDAYTKLMLHGEDFTDSSFAPRNIVNTGATIVEGFFGNAIQINGVNIYVRFGIIGEYNFLHNGTEDYTIDFRFKPIIGKPYYISTNGGASANSGIFIGIVNDVVTFALSRGVGGSFAINMSFTLTNASIFNHVALVKIGNVYTLYENGQPKITQTQTLTLSTANHTDAIFGTSAIGAVANCGGITDELRISRGVGRWSEPFTPPTTPYSENLEAYSTMLEQQIIESEYQNL